MRTTTVRFQEVAVTGQKRGKCPGCGGTAERQQRFYQTINPFNRNADGRPKTQPEIVAELRAQVEAWKAEPVRHVRCQP